MSRSRDAREQLKQLAPVAFGVEDASHLVATRSVPIKVPVLEFNPRLGVSDRDESNLDLRIERRIVLEVRVDVPRQNEPGRRLPDDDATPVAGAAVVPALVPAATDARLDHGVDPLGLSDLVVAEGPPGPHLRGEDPPCCLLRRLHLKGLANAVRVERRLCVFGHRSAPFLASSSAASLNRVSAVSQNVSSQLRRASTPRASIV